MIRFLLYCFVSICIQSLHAAKVETVQVKSSKMNREIEVLVITPSNYNEDKEYPTLYLLHGYDGNAGSWLEINPQLSEMSDSDEIIVVCPDGENSWYWDSPKMEKSQFETFVSQELISYIDSHYHTIRNRSGRAITGYSMGGHGGLWLSIRHKDKFGACGSMSGGVDIRDYPDYWDMKLQLGEKENNNDVWEKHTVINLLDKLNNGDLEIIIDCGSDDFFIDVNNNLHNELLRRGINHDYTIRPGEHNNLYWKNAVEYQWLFFKKYFSGYRNTI